MQTNDTTKKLLTTKLFKDRKSVESAYQNALDRGYTEKEINLVMSDETRKKHFLNSDIPNTVIGDKSMDGLALGGAAGGAIGGIAAAIAAIGTALVIPGLGIIVAGPLAVGLAGAGVGSIAGGLIGSLIGWGIPEERVQEYEKGIKSGDILLAVHSHDENDSKQLENDWGKFQ